MKKIMLFVLAILVIAAAVGLFYILRKTIVQDSQNSTSTNADLDIRDKNIPTIPTGWKTYSNNQYEFSVSYPADFQLQFPSADNSSDWEYIGNTDATGTKIIDIYIPKSFEGDKTNFGDANFRVGASQSSTALSQCLNPIPANLITDTSNLTINGTNYFKFATTDAGAGNRYQITSYRTIKNNTCFAVDLMVHYSVLENYDPSMGIKAFDQNKIDSVLNQILNTFYFNV